MTACQFCLQQELHSHNLDSLSSCGRASKFQLYGFADEIDGMERFIAACEQRDLQGSNNALNDLKPLVRKRHTTRN